MNKFINIAIIGCIRWWNSGNNGQFLVIADNMMNLELLFEGSKHTNTTHGIRHYTKWHYLILTKLLKSTSEAITVTITWSHSTKPMAKLSSNTQLKDMPTGRVLGTKPIMAYSGTINRLSTNSSHILKAAEEFLIIL